MPRSGRSLRPVVENVEPRALLSGIIGGPMAATSSGGSQSLQLAGTVHGHYHAVGVPSYAGATFAATGTGKVSGIGRTTAKGDLYGSASLSQLTTEGDVTLKGSKGKVTIHLTGVPDPGGSQALPSVFSFAITSATGKYRGAHESGTATVTLEPGNAGAQATRGSFVLTLTPRAIAL